MKSSFCIFFGLLISCTTATKAQQNQINMLYNTKPINTTLYNNLPNELSFIENFSKDIQFDSIQIKTESESEIGKISYGLFTVTPANNCTHVFLSFYLNDSLIGREFYPVKKSNNPSFYSNQISNTPETTLFDDNKLNDFHSAEELKKIRELNLMFDFGTGKNGVVYDINMFNISVVRNGNTIKSVHNETGILNQKTIDLLNNLEPNDMILITDIECELTNGKDKRTFNYNVITVK